jgi:hypothetical protein
MAFRTAPQLGIGSRANMTPKIQSIVTQFVQDLTEAIQEEGAAAFRAAIAGDHQIGNGMRALGGQVGNGRRKPGPKPKTATRAKGAKRDPQEIEAQTKTLLAAIKKTPGSRIEEISRSVGISTKDLALPVAKLFDMKAIKTTGQRRATKYFPK